MVLDLKIKNMSISNITVGKTRIQSSEGVPSHSSKLGALYINTINGDYYKNITDHNVTVFSDFVCEKHNIEVSLLNVCDSHQLSNESVSKNSNCSNCNHFEKSSCAHPSSASEGVLCFSWQSN